MGKRRARSPSPPSSSSSSSGAVDEEVDPRQAGILDKAAAQKRAEAGEASDAPPTTAPTSAAVLARGRGREGTPEPVDDENDGENYEVRRLLRNPRYFDDDFELAAVRCFRCGGGGHREAECSRAPKTRPCHLCGDADHVARDCPRGLCFNCLRPGHRSRDCDEKRGFGRETQSLRCLRCGERGHAVGTCDADFSSKDLRQMTCYVCGASGHLCCAPMDAAAKSWDLGSRTRSCCRCGGTGHVDSECAQGRRGGLAEHDGGGGASVFACFRCGGTGHIARECPGAAQQPSGGDLRQTLTAGGAGGPDRGPDRGGAQTKYGAVSGGGVRSAAAAGASADGPWGRARRRRLGRAERRAAGRWCDLGRARSGPGGMGDGETEVGAVLD